MSRHWKEPLDPQSHRDYMSGAQDAGGWPRDPRDEWTYFVAVGDFTFEFASVEQVRECLAWCREKVHPSSITPNVCLEHYWQRWYERLPPGLLKGRRRARVVAALERALAEFDV